MNIAIYRVSDGYILRTMSIFNEEMASDFIEAGEEYVIGNAVPGVDRVERGVIVAGTPPEKTYAQLRREAYPPLEALADAIYWQSRGKPDLMAAYVAQVAHVKQTYPKPEVK